jgi:hypothetical protein
MFKKLLQSLSRSPSPPASAPTAPAPAAKKSGPLPVAPTKPGGVLGKIVKGDMAAAPVPNSPEQLCGISPKMSRDEISAQLKLLYRRYNRSASSLDAQTRSEADKMLDAIVAVREKHIGMI